MAEKYEYIATRNGYLNDIEGYGYVEEGQLVSLKKQISCSWLVPKNEARPVDKSFNLPKVLQSKTDLDVRRNPPIVNDPHMQSQIQTLQEHEARADGVQVIVNHPAPQSPVPSIEEDTRPQPPADPATETPSAETASEPAADNAGEGGETETGGDAETGTGNQEVL